MGFQLCKPHSITEPDFTTKHRLAMTNPNFPFTHFESVELLSQNTFFFFCVLKGTLARSTLGSHDGTQLSAKTIFLRASDFLYAHFPPCSAFVIKRGYRVRTQSLARLFHCKNSDGNHRTPAKNDFVPISSLTRPLFKSWFFAFHANVIIQ